jgi:hypothetical protein
LPETNTTNKKSRSAADRLPLKESVPQIGSVFISALSSFLWL